MYGARTSTGVFTRPRGLRERLRDVQVPIAARQFYSGILGGRQVWPTDRRKKARSLWFLVGDTLIEVDPARAVVPEAIEVAVEAPNAMAERCWNAGYTVRLRDDVADDACSAFLITDPFGRSIALTPRAARESVGSIAG